MPSTPSSVNFGNNGSGADQLPEEVQHLLKLARESRGALMDPQFPGYDAIRAEMGTRIEHIVPSARPKDPRILAPIPGDIYDIERPLDEAQMKLGVDLADLAKSLVAKADDAPAHLLYEAGPGLGRGAFELQNTLSRDYSGTAPLRYVGQLDHFYYKLSTILRAFFAHPKLDELAQKSGPIPDLKQTDIKEFGSVLTLYLLHENPNLAQALAQNPEVEIRRILTDASTWEGLWECVQAKTLRNPKDPLSTEGYDPPSNVRLLIRAFTQNPRNFFLDMEENLQFRKDPSRYFGIRDVATILGGDMVEFAPSLPEGIIRLGWGVRSTIWTMQESTGGHPDRVVPHMVHMARALAPGGVYIDDWPRGLFDRVHYTAQLAALRDALARDAQLSHNTSLSVVWGPSDEFPAQHLFIPKAAVLTKGAQGRSPEGAVNNHLLRTQFNRSIGRNHRLIPVDERLVPAFAEYGAPRQSTEKMPVYRSRMKRLLEALVGQ